MRTRSVIGVISLSASLLAAPAVFADVTRVNYPTPMPIGTSVSGTITNIDPVNQMIQVRDGSGMVQTIQIDSHVQIYHDNKPISLQTLSLGDAVTVISL